MVPRTGRRPVPGAVPRVEGTAPGGGCSGGRGLIPYFVVPPLHLGPVPIQPFGVLSAAGVWLASWLLVRRARRSGLDPEPVEKLAGWALLGGMVGAHLVHLLLYHPEELSQNGPLQLLKIWDGLSSTGGVIGGLVASIAYLRHR